MTKKKYRPLKKPIQRRSENTYKSILQASLLLLKEEGIDKFNTNSIANKAGVSVSSLYQYFPSKESVLAEATVYFMGLQDDYIISQLNGMDTKATLKDALNVLFKSLFEFNKNNRELIQLLHQYVPELDRSLELKELDHSMLYYLEQIALNFKAQIRDGENAELVTNRVRILFHMVKGVLFSLHNDHLSPDFSEEKLIAELSHISHNYLLK